jgi:hypothetical protein
MAAWRKGARVRITGRRRSDTGFEVLGEDGQVLHHSPRLDGALTHLWAVLRCLPVRTYRVRVAVRSTEAAP